jgi:antitoxin CptB
MTDSQNLIKQLFYRSIHRGCKETDFLVGNFAQDNLSKMNENELKIFSDFLQEDDMKIYDWILQKIEIPNNYLALIERIRNFHQI